MNAEYYIKELGLQKHPEGGWFKEVYRSEEFTERIHLPARYSGARHHSTSIYFLLAGAEYSGFHRIKSDELWHFYAGTGLTVYMINDAGNYSEIKLGSNHAAGEVFQCAIPRGVWFGATVNQPDSFSLAGCTVAPGFHFDDFELAERGDMLYKFPQHRELIVRLTR